MTPKLNRVFWTLTVCLLLMPLFASKIAAASAKTEISITPFLQQIRLSDQPSQNFDVIFANSSDQSQSLDLSVADFGSLDESGGVAFIGSQFGQLLDKYTLSPWLKLSASTLQLSPKSQATVTATVVNDPQMGPGGHYAAIVGTLRTPPAGSGNQVQLSPKITSLVFVVKTGGEKYDLQLENIDSNANLVRLPSEVDLKFKATGNVHVVPRGLVYLKDSSGKVLAQGVINQESGYVLPSASRVINVPLKKIASSKPWGTGFYLQVDYRYDGIDHYASKKAKLTYISPLLVAVAALLIALVVSIKQNWLSVFSYQKKRKN